MVSYVYCLNLLSITMIKTMAKSSLGRKRFICPTYSGCLHGEGYSGQESKQVRNLEAKTKAEAVKKYFLMACSSWFAHPVFLYNTGPHT